VPIPDLLRRAGVFLKPGFLDLATCRAICAEMMAAAGEPGHITTSAGTQMVDPTFKNLRSVDVSPGLTDEVSARLTAIRPELDAHFGAALGEGEGVMFYRYAAGDFFAKHQDTYGGRRASIVLFLNDPSGGAGVAYEGGSLVLFDLFDDPRMANHGVSVPAEAGLLVAFRPELRHEVTPVVSGTRCVMVERLS
jgi:SM-20-related protein